MEQTPNNRRSFVRKAGAFLAALGFGSAATPNAFGAEPKAVTSKRVVGEVIKQDQVPLFSTAVAHGNTLYVSGIGAHFEGDVKAHTDHVLTQMQKVLEDNGSSMEKVLKVNVYLHDLQDYHDMNSVFRGRFGDSPGVRTTVAVYGGVPGDSLVEIDCIAALD